MTSLGDRIRKFGVTTHGSIAAFAAAMEMPASNIHKYLNEERHPGFQILTRLHDLGCDLNWLFSGRGDMFAENRAGKSLRARADRESRRNGR